MVCSGMGVLDYQTAGESHGPALVTILTGLPARLHLDMGLINGELERRQGIEPGDPVLTGDGLLGRVGETYDDLSRVTLITDPNSAVACEVESTGVLGVLRFTMSPRPRLLLTGVPLADTVRSGQRVVTSGMSRRYPRGIPVGNIVHVGKDTRLLTQDIEVEPAVPIARLRLAFITPQPATLAGTP